MFLCDISNMVQVSWLTLLWVMGMLLRCTLHFRESLWSHWPLPMLDTALSIWVTVTVLLFLFWKAGSHFLLLVLTLKIMTLVLSHGLALWCILPAVLLFLRLLLFTCASALPNTWPAVPASSVFAVRLTS